MKGFDCQSCSQGVAIVDVVGDIIEVGIESVESPKEIQLQIVKEMKKQ